MLGRATYLINNIEFDKWFVKQPGQKFLQTFHGYPYKGMGKDWWERSGLPTSRISSFVERAADWDYLVSPAGYATPLLLDAFRRIRAARPAALVSVAVMSTACGDPVAPSLDTVIVATTEATYTRPGVVLVGNGVHPQHDHDERSRRPKRGSRAAAPDVHPDQLLAEAEQQRGRNREVVVVEEGAPGWRRLANQEHPDPFGAVAPAKPLEAGVVVRHAVPSFRALTGSGVIVGAIDPRSCE